MRTAMITRVLRMASDMVTLYFEDEECSKASPGQYAMIWIPGGEEIPMSLSTINPGGESSLTVRGVGEATRILCDMKEGDKIGIRGPFGRGYTLVGDEPLSSERGPSLTCPSGTGWRNSSATDSSSRRTMAPAASMASPPSAQKS